MADLLSHSRETLIGPHVRMANDIARQFAYLGPDQGAAAVVQHLSTFWDPRMRGVLHEHALAGGEGLDPLALDAARRLGTNPR